MSGEELKPAAWMYVDKYGCERVWMMRQSMQYVQAVAEILLYAHPLPEQPQEAQIEAAAKAHCDFFGGQGWWDSGLIADTKPKALEAMRVALATLYPPSTETKESGDA